MPQILIFTHTPYNGITLAYISVHELAIRDRQLDSVAQLLRALHRNGRAAGSIPARAFATANRCSMIFTLAFFIYKTPQQLVLFTYKHTVK